MSTLQSIFDFLANNITVVGTAVAFYVAGHVKTVPKIWTTVTALVAKVKGWFSKAPTQTSIDARIAALESLMQKYLSANAPPAPTPPAAVTTIKPVT
jgi:hypothetical protein